MELIDNVIELTKLTLASSTEIDEEDYIQCGKETELDQKTIRRLKEEHNRNTEKLIKEGKLITVRDFCFFK
ncbi:MAG: hypothetical protein N2376_00610 [Clostridia bacterium]|nr:hypothetical protein [Clostridia bacterium]